MPNTKNFYLRVRILDGLLQSRKGVSIQECLRVINNRLAARDIPPVTSKDTILKDMTEIANEKHIIIESFPDTFDRRIIRYRYEQAGFSIFPTSLTDDDIKEIEGALELLSRFDGMPQMQWIRDLCSRFDVTLNSADMPVVEFEESDTVFGREFFTGLKKARTHLLYPYYLKQFKQRWYLIAKNAHHLDSISAYALDRMISFHHSLMDDYVPIDIDVHEYFKDVYGIARLDGEPETIRFHVDRHELPYLQTRPIHHSQKIVGRDKTGVFMTIHVIPNTELLMELMSYGDGITVKTTGKLRREIMGKLRCARKKYGSST